MDFCSVLSIPHLDTHNDPTDGTSISYLWQGYHLGYHWTRVALSQPVCKQLDAFFSSAFRMEIWQPILSRAASHRGLLIQLVVTKNINSGILNCAISSLITLSTRSHRCSLNKSNTSNCGHLYFVFTGQSRHPWQWDLISTARRARSRSLLQAAQLCWAWDHASLRLFGNVEIPGIPVKLDEDAVWLCTSEKYVHLVKLSVCKLMVKSVITVLFFLWALNLRLGWQSETKHVSPFPPQEQINTREAALPFHGIFH